jgi:hypothetical protein
MISKIYKMSDAEFSVWLENFENVLENNLAALNLTAANLTELQALSGEMKDALAERQSVEEMKRAKIVKLREKRKAVVKKVAYYNKILPANEAISGELIEMLGLNAAIPNTAVVNPNRPVELIAESSASGVNELRWKKNGNRAGTFYIVESRLESEPKFVYTGSTSKTKFEHKNQRPGVRMFYRVKAQRSDTESVYSNEAVVY